MANSVQHRPFAPALSVHWPPDPDGPSWKRKPAQIVKSQCVDLKVDGIKIRLRFSDGPRSETATAIELAGPLWMDAEIL